MRTLAAVFVAPLALFLFTQEANAGGILCALESQVKDLVESHDSGEPNAIVARAQEIQSTVADVLASGRILQEFPSTPADMLKVAEYLLRGIRENTGEIIRSVPHGKPVKIQVAEVQSLYSLLRETLLAN